MTGVRSQRVISGVLAGLLIFGAVSSFGGAVLALSYDGAGVPLERLDGTWLSSLLVLGLILGLVVGGTQQAAAWAVLRRRRRAPLAAAVAGFGMLIWIYVELAILGYAWLQTVYFALGIAELALVLLLLGILPGAPPSEPAPPDDPARDRRPGRASGYGKS